MAEILRVGERRALQAAIAAAERSHRGEIRVHLESRYAGDGPVRRAEILFHELGLDRTQDGTGVLLYVAARDRKAAVFAGPGVYGAREPGFWNDVAAAVARGYADGDRIAGLLRAVEMIGEILRSAAPGEDTAGNELPNQVTTT
ncbi:MAG TPA: TPM domain-containing protein [Kofleriaceae bacterium]